MKKHMLIFVLACCVLNCSDKEHSESMGTWVQLQDFPGEGRNGSVAFSVLGKGYWGFGSNSTSSFLRDLWSYDPVTGAWEQKKDFPFDLPAETAVSINNKGYVLTFSGSLYEYTPETDTWKYLSTIPSGIAVNGTGFVLGGNAYFGGGGISTTLHQFYKYDPAQNEWTRIKDLPGPERTDPISFVTGDNAFVGLGFTGQGAPPILTDMYRYDPTADHWEAVADFPLSTSLVGITFASDSRGYVGVPANNQAHRAQVFEYNPTGNSWRPVSGFPSGNSLETRSFYLNDRMFVIGGWWSEISSQVWEFIP